MVRTAARMVAYAQQHGLSAAQLAEVRLPWYEIRNQAGTDGQDDEATVWIFDEIGGSFGVDAKEFAQELEAITAPVIKVRINSPGGSVFDSIAIHSALLHHPSKIVVYVDGIAASGASVIAMAGDEVIMMPGSQLMIHDAWSVQEGPEADMLKMGNFLGRQSNNVAGMYARRGGGDASEWRALMLEETWMLDHEAVGFGLANRVEEPARRQDDAVTDQSMSRAHDLSHWAYRYAGRAEAPTPQRRSVAPPPTPTRAVGGVIATPRVVRERDVDEVLVPARRRVADAYREDCGRAAMSRRDQVRARADRPSQRRCAPDRDSRGVLVAKADMRLQAVGGEQPTAWEFRGVASAYEREYEMWDQYGPYVEVVSAGGGERSLRRPDLDVPLVLDHSSLRRIARTTNGSLHLSETDSGLQVLAPELDAADVDVAYIVPKILSDLVDEMSFRFMIESGVWSADFTTYRIQAYELHRGDVTIIGYGANPHTSTTVRRRDNAGDQSILGMRLALAIAE